MMLSGTCQRLTLVAAVFLIVAIFLIPQLGYSGQQIAHPPPTTPKGGAASTGPSDDPARKGQQDAAIGSAPAATSASSAVAAAGPSPSPSPADKPNKPNKPAKPIPDPAPAGAKPGGGTASTAVSKLEAGQSLQPFRLTSPSGRFELHLLDSGSLSLVDTKTDAELFTSDTEYHWPVAWRVELTREGVLMLSWSNETAAPFGATPWVSNMLPDCGLAESGEKPVLELLDSGELRIRAGRQTTCLLRRAADDMGRLAIVYTGFLRTYLQTCEAQNEKLVKTWSGSGGADVHVFTYLEDALHEPGDEVTKESIKKHLKRCFGDALKTFEVLRLEDVRETAPDPPAAVLEACGGAEKLDRQLSQWKALYLAGRQVQRYMVEEGVSYDYVYKGRLDLWFWGDAPPLSSLRPPEGGILAPRVALDWTWYAMLHDGELRAGVTDITAFGRPGPMFTYLSLYREFVHLRAVEKEGARWKGFNTKARDKADGDEGCTPEGILAYWLRINGIAVKTDWRFQMGLLRGDGKVIFTCPEDRGWLCPGFVPQVHDDGTFF